MPDDFTKINSHASALARCTAEQTSGFCVGQGDRAATLDIFQFVWLRVLTRDCGVQDGVREVEAVISAWDTKSLILVFFLYASTCDKIRFPTLALSKHLRDLHGRLYALHNVHRVLSLCHQRLLPTFPHGDYQHSFEHPWRSFTFAPLQDHRCNSLVAVPATIHHHLGLPETRLIDPRNQPRLKSNLNIKAI
jgi:hypothetical protein